ncbi:MAG: LptE family protein [candidate division WOR-3 bacterium]
MNKRLYLYFFLLFVSCSYSFKSGYFKGSLSISSLNNNTGNPDIERLLTERLVDAFIKDGRVELKMDSKGDYILEGVIDDYKRTPEAYTPGGEIESYRLSIGVRFSLKKKDKDESEWERSILESFVYSVNSRELEAIDSVASKIKSSLLRIMLEEW